MVDFLEEATGILDKVKHTAANVTTCQVSVLQLGSATR
jgi:hypothetical protein